jgi:ABC-2 type transport system ATP-binding protein
MAEESEQTAPSPPSGSAISLRGVVKRYGSIVAVNDLSFSIRPGLVTGFLGPNGAGKPNLGF